MPSPRLRDAATQILRGRVQQVGVFRRVARVACSNKQKRSQAGQYGHGQSDQVSQIPLICRITQIAQTVRDERHAGPKEEPRRQQLVALLQMSIISAQQQDQQTNSLPESDNTRGRWASLGGLRERRERTPENPKSKKCPIS